MSKSNRKERRAMEVKKRKEVTKFRLSNEERLELYNVNLKKQLIDTQVRSQMAIIEKEEATVKEKVRKRHGVDLQDYQLNLETGECIKRTEEAGPGPRQTPPEPVEKEPTPETTAAEDQDEDEDEGEDSEYLKAEDDQDIEPEGKEEVAA